jgi:hypothetical protein
VYKILESISEGRGFEMIFSAKSGNAMAKNFAL